MRGPWYLTRSAVRDYLSLTGHDPEHATDDERARAEDELQAQIAQAHYVKDARAPHTELWRGPPPKRLRFLVRMAGRREGDAPQLVRVEGSHRDQRRQPNRVRRATLWDGQQTIEIEFTDQVTEAGGKRRVAYLLTDGDWLTGFRGRTRPDHVEPMRRQKRVPEWVKALRGRNTERRGGRTQ